MSSIVKKIRTEFDFIKGNFALLMIGSIITDFGIEMAFTFYPLYVKELGGTVATVGLLGSIRGIISALTRFPGGYIADRYGRKQVLWSMTLLTAFSLLLYSVAPSWEFILLGVIINGIASIYGPAFDAIIMDSVPQQSRGTGYSIIQLLNNTSTTPAPLIAGFLYLNYGLVTGTRISFLILSLTYFAAAFLRYKITETMKDSKPIKIKELVNSLTGAQVYVEGIKVWWEVPKSLRYLLIIEILATIPNSMNITMIFYFIDDLGVSPENLTIIYTMISLSILLFAVPLGRLVDRYGRKNPILISWLLRAVLYSLLLAASFEMLLIIRPITALVNVVLNSAKSSLIADHTPREHRGKIAGSRDFFILVTSSVGSIIGGHIYDTLSHTLSIYIMIAFSLLLSVLTYLFVKEPAKKKYSE